MKEIQLKKDQANIVYPEDVEERHIIVGLLKFENASYTGWYKLHYAPQKFYEKCYSWFSLNDSQFYCNYYDTMEEALNNDVVCRAYILGDITELSDLILGIE